MNSDLAKVEEFYKRNGFRMRRPLSKELDGLNDLERDRVDVSLQDVSVALAPMAQRLLNTALQVQGRESRIWQAHLLVEELSELLSALLTMDENALADALADLLFVTAGTALSFDIPLPEVFREVCRSNLTKTRSPDDVRMRSCKKSPDYSPPNIEDAIKRGRQGDQNHD
jgi:NTP pyrophosphatase (non-canonical NTP hydrolase)